MTLVFMSSDLERRLWKRPLKATFESCRRTCNNLLWLLYFDRVEVNECLSVDCRLKKWQFLMFYRVFRVLYTVLVSYWITKLFELFLPVLSHNSCFFKKVNRRKCVTWPPRQVPFERCPFNPDGHTPWKKRSAIWVFFSC